MFSSLEFLNPDYYRVSSENSIAIVAACLVSFVAGLWIAILAYQNSIRTRSAASFWCGNFSLGYALWNIFFLSAYAQRDIQFFATSLSADLSERAYLAVAALLPSLAHACVRRIYHARFLISNQMHLFSIVLALGAFFLKDQDTLFYYRFVCGLYSFTAMAYLNWKIWRRYKRAQDLRLKTQSLFIGLGLSVSLGLSLLGQLRAEGLLRIPLPYLGNLVSVVFIYFIYKMISNQRLREIRELMLRGIRVLALTTILGVIFVSLLVWVGENDPELFLFNTFLASFIIISVMDPLRRQLDAFILRRLIMDRYELENILLTTLRKMRRTHSIDELTTCLLKGCRESDRIYRTGLYLMDSQQDVFRLVAESNLNTDKQLPSDHPLVYYLRNHLDSYLHEQDGSSDAQKLLRDLRAHLIFPIAVNDELIGIWIIRTSLSERNPYTSLSDSEIQLLEKMITELGSLIDQLQYFERQDQQQRLAALGEMSAALAHEIRNPLGAIQGAAQLLESSPTLTNSEDKECVSILTTELDRLQQTVNQYLQYARKSDELVLTAVPELIRASIAAAQQKAQKTGTLLHYQSGSEVLEILTDPLKLEQVLINLLVNACEAFSKNVWILASIESAELRVEIKDDGPGIPADVLPNIFTPLFTTKRAGSGLGLPICKKIVDSLGGELSVRSELLRGTVFIIHLPTKREALSEQSTAESKADSSQ